MDGFERGVVVRHLIHRPRHRERPVHTGSGPIAPGDGSLRGQNSSSSSTNSMGS
jgi:hypothetical protein